MADVPTEDIVKPYLEAIENELQCAVLRANEFGSSPLHDMLAYHMGWDSEAKKNELRGKRIRPLLVLLSCAAAGGDWRGALPAACAVELVHNFSLIHDDIEDRSPLRRGRPTLWKRWGVPQAVNCGDAMFALAHLAVLGLSSSVSPIIAMKAVELLQSTCLHLTQGQYLDLSYEAKKDISIEDYWRMVEGKTAALMAASTELGALSASKDEQTCLLFRKFGHSLGLAFQAQDDLLGIWGNSRLTGKSSQSDLVAGKITLPVLYGVSQSGSFASRWKQGPISAREAPEFMKLLEHEGAKHYTEQQVKLYVNEALTVLAQTQATGPDSEMIKNLALGLIDRQV